MLLSVTGTIVLAIIATNHRLTPIKYICGSIVFELFFDLVKFIMTHPVKPQIRATISKYPIFSLRTKYASTGTSKGAKLAIMEALLIGKYLRAIK